MVTRAAVWKPRRRAVRRARPVSRCWRTGFAGRFSCTRVFRPAEGLGKQVDRARAPARRCAADRDERAALSVHAESTRPRPRPRSVVDVTRNSRATSSNWTRASSRGLDRTPCGARSGARASGDCPPGERTCGPAPCHWRSGLSHQRSGPGRGKGWVQIRVTFFRSRRTRTRAEVAAGDHPPTRRRSPSAVSARCFSLCQ